MSHDAEQAKLVSAPFAMSSEGKSWRSGDDACGFLAISRGSPNFTPFVPFPLKDFVKNACRHRLVIAREDAILILE